MKDLDQYKGLAVGIIVVIFLFLIRISLTSTPYLPEEDYSDAGPSRLKSNSSRSPSSLSKRGLTGQEEEEYLYRKTQRPEEEMDFFDHTQSEKGPVEEISPLTPVMSKPSVASTAASSGEDYAPYLYHNSNQYVPTVAQAPTAPSQSETSSGSSHQPTPGSFVFSNTSPPPLTSTDSETDSAEDSQTDTSSGGGSGSGSGSDDDDEDSYTVPVVAADFSVSTDENTAVNFTAASATLDPDQIPLYQILSAPTHGTISNCMSAGGSTSDGDLSCTYTPTFGYNGPDSFTYRVYDGINWSVGFTTVNVTVNNSINNLPVAGSDQNIVTNKDLMIAFSVNPATDGDFNTTLTYEVVDAPDSGTLANCMDASGADDGSDLSCEYTPNGGFFGSDSLSYRVYDGQGYSVGVGTINITVNNSTIDPVLITVTSDNPTNTTTATFTVSSCGSGDADFILFGTSAPPSVSDAGWVACSTVADNYSQTLSTLNGNNTFYVWGKDASDSVSSSYTQLTVRHDDTPPAPVEIIIAPRSDDPNLGRAYSGTIFVTLSAKVSDTHTGTKVRFKLSDGVGNCSLTAAEESDNQWKDSSLSTTSGRESYSFILSAGDGTKKVCMWVKDAAGNISTIDDSVAAKSIHWDDISLQVANIPVVTALTVINDHVGSPRFGTTDFIAGETVKVSWSLADVEGLDNNPISLYVVDETTSTPLIVDYGSLSGNPTSYSDSYSFAAGSNTFFRIKAMAKDIAGNTSIAVLSDSLNTSPWSIYAGSRDIGDGGVGKSALIAGYPNSNLMPIAVNPLNNDIWFIDYNNGLRKLDAATGLISTVIPSGTANLSTAGGTITSTERISTGGLNIKFDNIGKLYISHHVSDDLFRIFRLDPVTLAYEYYAGGGTSNDVSDPKGLITLPGGFAIDEDNALYVNVACGTSTVHNSGEPFRLFKIPQDATSKVALTPVHVAGDCAAASYTTGVDAKTTLYLDSSPSLHTLEVWNRGNNIVYGGYTFSYVRKITNGTTYGSDLTLNSKAYGLAYNKFNGQLYAAYASDLQILNLNYGSDTGDSYTTIISSTDQAGCTDDDLLNTSACVVTNGAPSVGPTGTVFFPDGPSINSPRPYRIRYVDSEDKVRTIAGTLPNNAHGFGLHRSVLRAQIRGIYFKGAGEPNQAAFPSGLYFVDSDGMTFNYIDPVSGITEVLHGNQSNISRGVYSTLLSDVMTPALTFGEAYTQGGVGRSLMFDETGLPWLIQNNRIVSINSSFNMVPRQTGTSYWDENTTAVAKNTDARVHGGANNLVGDSLNAFLQGQYTGAGANTTYSVLRQLDWGADQLIHLMGASAGSSAATTVAGSLAAKSFASACNNHSKCYLNYDRALDRLYYSENTRIRYIENVTVPANHYLRDLYTGSPFNIFNIILSPNKDMMFYLSDDGELYCHNISSANAWCDNSLLGPAPGMQTIQRGANQMTWLDNTTLLISNNRGEVYALDLNGL